jgi:hypothetical protein
VVAIFNVGSEPLALQPTWKMFGVAEPAHSVVNLMTGERTVNHPALDVHLAPHASAVYRLERTRAASMLQRDRKLVDRS